MQKTVSNSFPLSLGLFPLPVFNDLSCFNTNPVFKKKNSDQSHVLRNVNYIHHSILGFMPISNYDELDIKLL